MLSTLLIAPVLPLFAPVLHSTLSVLRILPVPSSLLSRHPGPCFATDPARPCRVSAAAAADRLPRDFVGAVLTPDSLQAVAAVGDPLTNKHSQSLRNACRLLPAGLRLASRRLSGRPSALESMALARSLRLHTVQPSLTRINESFFASARPGRPGPPAEEGWIRVVKSKRKGHTVTFTSNSALNLTGSRSAVCRELRIRDCKIGGGLIRREMKHSPCHTDQAARSAWREEV